MPEHVDPFIAEFEGARDGHRAPEGTVRTGVRVCLWMTVISGLVGVCIAALLTGLLSLEGSVGPRSMLQAPIDGPVASVLALLLVGIALVGAGLYLYRPFGEPARRWLFGLAVSDALFGGLVLGTC